MISFAYIILALLGLSFLIFIHELGHYWAARRVGMRVEVFAIGFGKSLCSWNYRGVKWQIGWIPFGGYVKIAGQDASDSGKDPYEISDSFFGKTPAQRIFVALAGPAMNLLFAFFVFALLWGIGGREKNFSELTKKIGWVDPESELYIHGIRPGDEIVSYDTTPYESSYDHLYAPSTANGEILVSGNKVDYLQQTKKPFSYRVKTYNHPGALDKEIMTAGITQPASYIVYDKLSNGENNPLPEGSPLKGSGIELGDRIVWVDGEPLFSLQQLNHILNDDRLLLTIRRGNETFLRRVPRVGAQELRMDPSFRAELTDWQYEAGLEKKGRKLLSLYAIPYNTTNDLVVEERLNFIDAEEESKVFPKLLSSPLEEPLQPGDKIIAINGQPIRYSYQLLDKAQQRQVSLIVQRGAHLLVPIPSGEADRDFDKEIDWSALQKMVNTIGNGQPISELGNLRMLAVVTPKRQSEFFITPEAQALLTNEIQQQKKMIEQIEDPEERAQALNLLENQANQLILGIKRVQDRKVVYNPNPFSLFKTIANEIRRVLASIVTGDLSIKGLSGPVGIVYVVHERSMVSIKETLFWLGFISLNLGILNLLPIPVLDGGSVVFSLYEMITRQRIKPKTMEKLIFPFAILLFAALIFFTYNDLMRIFRGFLS